MRWRRMSIDSDTAWAALLRRDRSFDGQFVTGVHSTGIYCRPSCAARHPLRANVQFYVDGAAAQAAGLRACLRCLPQMQARDEAAVVLARTLLAAEVPPRLAALARSVGYAPQHFARVFRRLTGATPAQFVRAQRLACAQAALSSGASVTQAIYDAGYSAPSRFYDDAKGQLGMTPKSWKTGGAGEVIHWTTAPTNFGTILLAHTDKGICRLSFDEGEAELQSHFPLATLATGNKDTQALVASAIAVITDPRKMSAIPLDLRGTGFQQAVWRALWAIPAGETRSYAEIARAVGRPNAVRAVGRANGANPVSVLVPCHRVIRSDGGLGGYAYGLDRKRTLLERESTASYQATLYQSSHVAGDGAASDVESARELGASASVISAG